MRSKSVIFSALMVGLVLLLISGCSGDKGTDSNDTELQQIMRSQVEQDMNAILSSISQGYDELNGFDTLGAQDFLGKAVAPAYPLDTFYYEYKNGWHIAYISESSSATINDLDISYDASIADSVQFHHLGDIIQFPTATTDFVHFKIWMEMMLDMQLADTSLTMSIDNFHVDCTYDVQPKDSSALGMSDTASVNGDMEFDYSIQATQGSDHAEGSIAYTLNIDDLKIAQPYGCPQSGTISAALDINFEGPEAAINGEWTMTATFISDSYMYVVMDGPNTHFSYTGTYECGGGLLASPVQAFLDKYKGR